MAPNFLTFFSNPLFARRVVSPRAHGSLHKQDFIYCYKSGRCAMNSNNNNNNNNDDNDDDGSNVGHKDL